MKTSNILHGEITIAENNKSNYVRLYWVFDLTYSSPEQAYMNRKPSLKYYIFAAFCKGNKKYHNLKEGKQIINISADTNTTKILECIFNGWIKAKYSLFGFNSTYATAAYDLFESDFRPIMIDTDTAMVEDIEDSFNIAEYLLNKDKVVFRVARIDYIILKDSVEDNADAIINIRNTFLKRLEGADILNTVYPNLVNICNDWIDNKLTEEDINSLYAKKLFAFNVNNRYFVKTCSTSIYKKNKAGFLTTYCPESAKVSRLYKEFYYEQDNNNNLCVMTLNKMGKWWLNYINNKPLAEIEKNMCFYIFKDRIDRDLANFFDSKKLQYNQYFYYQYYMEITSEGNLPENIVRIPSLLIDRYRQTGYILGFPSSVTEKFLKEYVKRKLMGFDYIEEYTFKYDNKYNLTRIKAKYAKQDEEPLYIDSVY